MPPLHLVRTLGPCIVRGTPTVQKRCPADSPCPILLPMSGPSAVVVPPEISPPRGETSESLESRNILLLAGYQVMLRLAWVFKTESVVVPAFLHAISGQAWMQGWLPMLNRFGQSLPPLMYADHLRDMPRKKASLVRTTVAMGCAFAALAGLLVIASKPTAWWPPVFLMLYVVFFIATGLNTLAFNTLQGKLITPSRRTADESRRGRWFGGGDRSSVGRAAALECGGSFVVHSAIRGDGGRHVARCGDRCRGRGTRRSRRSFRSSRTSLREHLREAWLVVRHDRHFRRLAFCAMAFVTSQFLFPHYVPLASETLRDGTVHLTLYLIVQNVGVGLFSVLLGTLADRFGNRFALRSPSSRAVSRRCWRWRSPTRWIPGGRSFYWVTFFVLGMQPVTFKTFTNYTLELVEPARHPRYLSTLTICLAAPFLLSLPVGWLVGTVGLRAGVSVRRRVDRSCRLADLSNERAANVAPGDGARADDRRVTIGESPR